MTRATDEWIGKTDDAQIPDRVKVRVFGKGVCVDCGRKLRPGHWACDHIKALVNGGEHRETNLQPLCSSPCHWRKTRADVAEKSDVYAKRKKDIGLGRAKRTIPGRRFDGTPIPSRMR